MVVVTASWPRTTPRSNTTPSLRRVWSGHVHAKDVLAFISSHGEQEVIADPAKVVITEKRRLPWVPLSPLAVSREVRFHQGQHAELEQSVVSTTFCRDWAKHRKFGLHYVDDATNVAHCEVCYA